MAYNSFGQVIPVLGPNFGFPGNVSRVGERVIAARPVAASASATAGLPFGSGAVLTPTNSTTDGTWLSLADFLATAANAQYVNSQFAGVAVREVKTMLQYTALGQSTGTTVSTTATQATIGSTTIVVALATGISIGQAVEGFGIQPNTLVTGVSGTTITISLATTGVLSTTNVIFTSSIAPVTGYYSAGQMAEVLERGSITVNITNGTPYAGQVVYVRTVANANLGATAVGDFEASSDLATSSITIGTTAGSTALTTSAGTGLAIGQYITGPGIAANTTLVSGASTSWVMSQPALYTIASGGAMSAYNTIPLQLNSADPYVVFRTGNLDSNNVAEITIKSRRAA